LIIKPYAEGNAIERLTTLLADNAGRSKAIETEIRKVRAGLKGEREAAHYIDATLGSSENWAIIHGLRLETPYGVSQLDHVLLGRNMMAFVLETKHFRDGLKITEEGEFLRWSNYERRYQPMASPLMQCDRHEVGLRNFLKANGVYPTRLGMRLTPDIKSLVLVNPEAKLLRPGSIDTSKVVKADQFFEAMHREVDKLSVLGVLGKVAQMISSSTLKEVATALAAHDRPIEIDYAGKLGIPQATIEVSTTSSVVRDEMPDSSTGSLDAVPLTEKGVVHEPEPVGTPEAGFQPSCKACKSAKGEIRFGKFGYYWKCLACDGNTKLTLPGPGKLRKEGPRFYYVEEGKPEALLHVNGEVKIEA
jgi:hypothetical protein